MHIIDLVDLKLSKPNISFVLVDKVSPLSMWLYLQQSLVISKNSPLGPQKVKNDPKIMSKLKVRIEGTIENKSCSTT